MMSARQAGRRWAAVAAVVAFVGTASAVTATHTQAAEPEGDRRVTLATGDQVVLPGNDVARAVVKPGPGRQGILFQTHRDGNQLTVIPSDVLDDIADGRLDRRLFTIGDEPAQRRTAVRAASHTLTIKHLGPTGRPAAGYTTIYGISAAYEETVGDPAGTVTLTLPEGEYMLDGIQAVPLPDGVSADFYKIVRPSLQLTDDTTLVLDARATRDVKISVPQPGAEQALAAIGFRRDTAFGGFDLSAQIDDFKYLHTAQSGPSLSAERMTGTISSQWARRTDGSFANSPYLYGTEDTFPGSYPTGFQRVVRPDELAVVSQTINAAAGGSALAMVYGSKGSGTPWAAELEYRLPGRRQLFLDATAAWQLQSDEMDGETEISNVRTSPTRYQAGRRYDERLNAAVFAPAAAQVLHTGDALSITTDPDRSDDSPLAPLRDADGNLVRTRVDSESSTLYRDGKPVAESPHFGEIRATGAAATSTLVSRLTRPTTSTRIECSWTFNSATSLLPVVRFQPRVDAQNHVRRTPITTLPVTIDGPRARTASLQVSGDAGATWQPARLTSTGRNQYLATFDTPPGSTISLQAHWTDAQDNRVDLVVVDAYQLR